MGLFRLLWDQIRPRLGERRTAFGRMGTLGGFTFFLTAILFIPAAALTLAGFDLDRLSLWLEARGGLMSGVATFALRIGAGIVLLASLVLIGWGMLGRDARQNPGRDRPGRDKPGRDKPGLGCMAVALIIAYFAWIAVRSGDSL